MGTFPILLLAALVVLLVVNAVFPEKRDGKSSSRRPQTASRDRTDRDASPVQAVVQRDEAAVQTFLEP